MGSDILKAGFIFAAAAGFLLVTTSSRAKLKKIFSRIAKAKSSKTRIEPEKINFC